jgi:hypothetical protein
VPSRRRQHEPERGLLAAAIACHPREFVGLVVAAAAAVAILVNALFLQHGPHPAPIFATRASAAQAKPGPVDKVALPESKPKTITQAHNDPIAELIAPSKRVLAIQRALAEFGYGQLRPTGLYDHDTSVAIEKFERNRGLPVDGQISERLVRELATMTGRRLDQ